MSDYINREDAIKAIKKDIMGGLNYESILNCLPTADVEPVRHGRWEDFEQHSWSVNLARRCQICGWLVTYTQSIAFAYCPNCGARMDGEEQEHEHTD